MERRRRVVSPEEAKLWRDAMRGAIAFPDRLPTEPPEPPPAAAIVRVPALPTPPSRSPIPVAAPMPPPVLDSGRAPGLDKRSLGRLKKGEMTIEGSLDLHGLTQEAAHVALWRFVTGAAEQGRRCVLVITGKGNPQGIGVLRRQVPRWLNESTLRPLVLAFATARPQHGGDGALYVLLKRRR